MQQIDHAKRIQRLENQIAALVEYVAFTQLVLSEYLSTGEIKPDHIKRLSEGYKEVQMIKAPRINRGQEK